MIRVPANDPYWSAQRVCVLGAGYMGGGIGQILALAGARVTVTDVDEPTARVRAQAILEQARTYVERQLFPTGAEQTIAGRLTAAGLADAAADATLVVEAVAEDIEVKRAVLDRVSRLVPDGTTIATNTSSIPIATLASAVHRPERFLGVHWFNPPQFVPGVEIVVGAQTDPAIPPRLADALAAIGKWPAVVADRAGFVSNRLQFALFREAALLLEEGVATAEQVDEVVRGSFGYRLPFFGPFAIADMAGLDVYQAAFHILEEAYGARFATPAVLADHVAAGRLGTKAGGGFYDRTPGETAALIRRRDQWYAALADLVRGAPVGHFDVRPIGRVESALVDRHHAPRQSDEGAPDAWLVFDPAVADALRDVRVGDDLLLITWLHQADRSVLTTRPRGDANRPETGVFNTRSPDRPNPVGLHRVSITEVDGPRVRVSHLEAIDGTPIIDVKPVLGDIADR
jgi:3-hydroxybutyryl-CoA dehydrogenase